MYSCPVVTVNTISVVDVPYAAILQPAGGVLQDSPGIFCHPLQDDWLVNILKLSGHTDSFCYLCFCLCYSLRPGQVFSYSFQYIFVLINKNRISTQYCHLWYSLTKIKSYTSHTYNIFTFQASFLGNFWLNQDILIKSFQVGTLPVELFKISSHCLHKKTLHALF